jgi:hypothetical protein
VDIVPFTGTDDAQLHAAGIVKGVLICVNRGLDCNSKEMIYRGLDCNSKEMICN